MLTPKPEQKIDVMTGLLRPAFAAEELCRVVDEVDMVRTINPTSVIFCKGSIGVIFADIYKLKVPHDNYGHAPIDEVIINIGKVVRALAQEGDIACRYGGDEFLLILPGASENQTMQRAEELRQAAAEIKVLYEGQARENIILSVGVAHYPTLYQHYPNSKLRGAELLMRAADEDLGRDRIRNAQKGN